jgi:ankyrin repeat protein
MNRLHRIATVLCVVLATGLAGCATQHAELRSLDAEALHNALSSDDASYMQAALRGKIVSANDRIAALGYREGVPLLTVAARFAALEVIRLLLAAGADVNARTPDGDTALMLAAFFYNEDRQNGTNSYEQHEKAVRILIEAGAQVENHPHHYTPLAYAAYQGHDRIVRLLIERGARVDADADHEEGLTYVNTPLMMAVIQGHQATATALLRRGANARIRVRGGHTAAEFAERYNHHGLARMLRCAERLAPGEGYSHRCEAARAVNQ